MIIVDCEQYSPIWWDEHKGVPGGSTASRVITPSEWKPGSQIDDLCYELIAQYFDPDYGQNKEYVTAAMRNGTIMEPEARSLAEFETGQHIRRVGICFTKCRRFCVSPDGLTDDAVVELKSPEYKTQVKRLHKNEVPKEYLPQIHWSLAVTGYQRCIFMSYSRRLPPLLKVVERDWRTEGMLVAMEAFSARYEQIKNEVLGNEGSYLRQILAEARLDDVPVDSDPA